MVEGGRGGRVLARASLNLADYAGADRRQVALPVTAAKGVAAVPAGPPRLLVTIRWGHCLTVAGWRALRSGMHDVRRGGAQVYGHRQAGGASAS